MNRANIWIIFLTIQIAVSTPLSLKWQRQLIAIPVAFFEWLLTTHPNQLKCSKCSKFSENNKFLRAVNIEGGKGEGKDWTDWLWIWNLCFFSWEWFLVVWYRCPKSNISCSIQMFWIQRVCYNRGISLLHFLENFSVQTSKLRLPFSTEIWFANFVAQFFLIEVIYIPFSWPHFEKTATREIPFSNFIQKIFQFKHRSLDAYFQQECFFSKVIFLNTLVLVAI